MKQQGNERTIASESETRTTRLKARTKAQNFTFLKTKHLLIYTLLLYSICGRNFPSNHTILSSNSMNFKCVYLHRNCDSRVGKGGNAGVSICQALLGTAPFSVRGNELLNPTPIWKMRPKTNEQTKALQPLTDVEIVFSCKFHTYSTPICIAF